MTKLKTIAAVAVSGLALVAVSYGAHRLAEARTEAARPPEEVWEMQQAGPGDVQQKCPNMGTVGQEPGRANYWPNGYPGPTF